MTCEECEELAGAYALDAITPAEREAVRAHLAQCPNCRQQIEELRAIVGLLPLSVPEVEPPATLEQRVFAAIRDERAGNDGPANPPPQGMPRLQPVRPRQRSLVTQLLAVAAVLLLVLFGGMTAWNISLQQQISSLQHQNASLTQQLAKTYAISGTGSASGATGEVTYLPEQDLTVLIVRGLPQLQGTHVYQGWLISGNQPTSIGVLSIQDGVASVGFPGNITNYDVAAVSLEPGPGPSKNAPAGTIVAKGTLKPANQSA